MNRRGGFQRGRAGKRVQRKIQNNNNNEPQKRKARQNFTTNETDRVYLFNKIILRIIRKYVNSFWQVNVIILIVHFYIKNHKLKRLIHNNFKKYIILCYNY